MLCYCVRACRNREPRSDTPGIESTRDQIQLRDHQMVNQFPQTNYHGGKENHYGGIQPAPYPPEGAPTLPPPSYDDALVIAKEPIGEGAADKWDDNPEISTKQFGVI